MRVDVRSGSHASPRAGGWRSLLAAVIVVVAAGPAAGGGMAADASAATRCARTIPVATGPVRAQLELRGVSCTTAVRMARRYHQRAKRSQCEGSGCFTSWASGWTCGSTSAREWELTGRMFSCYRGSRSFTANAPSPY